MSAGGTSQRLPKPKIEFRCSCGKKYRVSASKAGKHVRCKNCRLKVQVPGEAPGISVRTRNAILDELGIAAQATSETKNKYACSLCGAKLKIGEESSSYAQAGLVCAICRESMGGGAPATEEAPAEPGKKKKKGKKKQLDTWTRGVDPDQARKKAYAYAGLFFLGTIGFCLNVVSLGWLLSLPIAAGVAYGGGKAIYNGYLADPVQAKRPGAKT